MDCQVSPEQLWKWIEEGSPELEAHLEVCASCRALASFARQMGEDFASSEFGGEDGGTPSVETTRPLLDEAEEAFLAALLQGEVDLEALVREHPEQARRLRELHAHYRPLAPVLERLAEPPSFADRIRRRLGADVDSGVSLDEAPGTPSPEGGEVPGLPRGPRSRYEVLGEIARGGMGAIYQVRDRDFRRTLAMKVCLSRRKDGSPDLRVVSRFVEEAQITGQLDHPGVVPVHELGVDEEGRVYFTMRLVRGRDLREIFRRLHQGDEEWTRTRVVGVLLNVCEAMAYAHSKGVVHRDLKPGNIMVGGFGETYVMDWGLAKVLRRSGEAVRTARQEASEDPSSPLATREGNIVGTPAYMAPEQARGEHERVDERTDVYAVGAMLYHLLAGTMPYVPRGGRRGSMEVLELVRQGPPDPLHRLAPQAPPELVAICEKAMARDPAQRYATMKDMARDLRAWLEGRVVQAWRTGAVAEFRKWVERNRGMAASLAAALVLLISGSAFAARWVTQKKRADQLQSANRTIAAQKEELEVRERRLSTQALQLQDLNRELQQLNAELAQERDALDRLNAELLEKQIALEEERAKLAEANDALRREQARVEAQNEELERQRDALEVSKGRIEAEKARAEAELAAKNRLADLIRLQQLIEEARDLGPARPENRARLAGWLRRAHVLHGERLLLHEQDLAAMRERADPSWDEEARQRDRQTHPLYPELQHLLERQRRKQDQLAQVLSGTERRFVLNELEILGRRIAALEREVSRRRTWRFERPEDQFDHDSLARLVDGLHAFRETIARVEHTYGLIEVAERAMEDSAQAWREASAAIELQYGLRLPPQFGLVPLGPDPWSGLWEFAHVQTGTPPERGRDGRLVLDEDSAVVLVLVPSGTATVGSVPPAEGEEDGHAFRSSLAAPDEAPVHRVDLEPFFLSKYELTQAQYERLAGVNPSRFAAGMHEGSQWFTGLHPVENLSWEEARAALSIVDLILPAETWWEYAARAGTDTPWWTGATPASVVGRLNLADPSALPFAVQQGWKTAIRNWPGEQGDGYPFHAPVDTFPANPFGFHHILGNVAEWCEDRYSEYAYDLPVDPRTGLRRWDQWVEELTERVSRGGHCRVSPSRSRSSTRLHHAPDEHHWFRGVRPARRLRLEAGDAAAAGRD